VATDYKDIVVRFRAEVKELEAGIKAAGDKVEDFSKGAQKSIEKIDWNKVAKGGIVVGAAMTGAAVGAEALIERNQALNKSLSSVSVTTGIENKKLRDMTFELADASTSVDDTAAALDALTRAGVTNEEEMMLAAKAFFTLGDATGVAEDQLITGLVPALKAFNIPASQMGEHMDTITYLMKTTTYDFSELANVFEKVAPKANALGLDFEDIAVAIKILSDRGVDGRTAISMVVEAMKADKVEDFYKALLIDPAQLQAQAGAMGNYAGKTQEFADAANATITPAQEAAQGLDEMGLQAGEAISPMSELVPLLAAAGPSLTAISTGVLAIQAVGGISAIVGSLPVLLAAAGAVGTIAYGIKDAQARQAQQDAGITPITITPEENPNYGQGLTDAQIEAYRRGLPFATDYDAKVALGWITPHDPANPGNTNPDIAHDQETGNYGYNNTSAGCFVAGTPVTMYDGTKKPIEYVHEGDVVLSFDPATGITHAGRVAETIRYQATMLHTLCFEDGSTVKCTGEHPFYVGDAAMSAPMVHERFVRARDLSVGDTVVRASGSGRIREIVTSECNTTVYNFNVMPWHTYIAGGCLVHNVKTMMAEGGIVTSPTAAIIGEAGPEAVIPLDRLGSGQPTIINVNCDGYNLFRIIVPYLKAGTTYNCGVR
jgi:hypothetical protein